MRTLVLTNRPIILARHGYDLRVANLCRHLPGERHLVQVPLAEPDRRAPTLDAGAIFDSVHTVDADLVEAKRPWRHLRLSEGNYLHLAFPAALASVRRQVRELAERLDATHILVFGSHLAEIARDLPCERRLFDVCDSIALTLRREVEHAGMQRRAGERWRRGVSLARWRRFEAALPRWFRTVTTINGADTEEVRRLAGGAANVHTLPNGVAEAFLQPLQPPAARRGVAFWGNLNFPPNAAALRFFMLEVYAPHLRHASVEVAIVGDKAPAWLHAMAEHDPHIRILGFVDDLAAAVREYPVMVNPMRIGSGMKNKVLEAFGLGLLVVSTGLGMESVPEARHGEHCLIADEPQAFASAVLAALVAPQEMQPMREQAHRLVHERYRWEAVSARLLELMEA